MVSWPLYLKPSKSRNITYLLMVSLGLTGKLGTAEDVVFRIIRANQCHIVVPYRAPRYMRNHI